MTAPTGPRRIARATSILAAALLSLTAPGLLMQAQQATAARTLTGTVTDTSHEPLHCAIVELQNPANSSVQSYLTDADGHYIFKHLSSESDYRVWVVFRGRHTPTRSISKFDSHPAKVINFTVRTY
jgi:hypothetical protein